MPEVRGCNIPDDLYYWPEKHVWARPNGDGSVTVGVTDVAQSLAHNILSALPKAEGPAGQEGPQSRHRGEQQMGGTGHLSHQRLRGGSQFVDELRPRGDQP